MINLNDQTITVFDPETETSVTEEILKWEVWFATIEGTFRDFDEAKASCARTGEPLIQMLQLAVATGTTVFEIVVPR